MGNSTPVQTLPKKLLKKGLNKRPINFVLPSSNNKPAMTGPKFGNKNPQLEFIRNGYQNQNQNKNQVQTGAFTNFQKQHKFQNLNKNNTMNSSNVYQQQGNQSVQQKFGSQQNPTAYKSDSIQYNQYGAKRKSPGLTDNRYLLILILD